MSDPKRYYGLDALRAGAMLLGLVLHASSVYMRDDFLALLAPDSTAAQPEATALTAMTSIWIHLWRMPTFFVLAGFFAQMSVERRGVRAFAQDRFVRIFLTLMLAMWALSLFRPFDFGVLAHLWFLWVLVICCALAPLTRFLAAGWIFERPRRAALLVLPVMLLGLWNRDNIWQDAPNTLWDPNWSSFAMYGFYFWIGQSLWQARTVLGVFSRWPIIAGLLIVGFAAHGALGQWYFAPWPEWFRQTVVAVAGLSFTFGLIGLAERLVRKPSRALRWGVESSYFIYIAHLFIVYAASIWMVEQGWNQHIAVPAAALWGLVVSGVLYLIFVRYTPLNWLLAGFRNSWWKWPLAANGTSK
ncbi:MAG: acyltransferase family protein [Pseudomonadota bacterium]